MAGEPSVDLNVVGAPVKAAFEAFKEKDGRALHLEIEPGTFLVANAGCLVSSVADIVTTAANEHGEGREFIKLDAGMTDVLRPSLYGAQHPLIVVPRAAAAADAAPKDYVVVGHCCESGDLMTPAPGDAETLATRALAPAAVGDALVIEVGGLARALVQR